MRGCAGDFDQPDLSIVLELLQRTVDSGDSQLGQFFLRLHENILSCQGMLGFYNNPAQHQFLLRGINHDSNFSCEGWRVKYEVMILIANSQIMVTTSNRSPAQISQLRSLLRDLADGLGQQMIFWGCDARHPHGNQLVQFGMQRIERASTQVEGSSRYRVEWQGGVIELHGFCVAWYPRDAYGDGAIFIRHRGRFLSTCGMQMHVPGDYDGERLGLHSPDELLELVIPFVSWWITYEEWIQSNTSPNYRELCWSEARRFKKSASWLRPVDALEWLRRFVLDPTNTPRARKNASHRRVATCAIATANTPGERNAWAKGL